LSKHLYRKYTCVAITAIALAGCTNNMEPARRSIGDIEKTVTESSTEAAQYAPDQLADVQSKLNGLKVSFDKRDFTDVIERAPSIMSEAESLASAAATAKAEINKVANQATPEAIPSPDLSSTPEAHHFTAVHVEKGLMISLADDNSGICDKLIGENPGYWKYAEMISSEGGPFDHDGKLFQLCWHEYKKGQKTWDGKRYPQNMIAMCPLKGTYRYERCGNDPSSTFDKLQK
jgi:hypothetical protein